jgi:anti-sigma B factor antagonist
MSTSTLQLTEQALQPAGVVLTASGELDIATAPELRDRLNAAVDAAAGRLVVDLRPVFFLDSVALAALLHARRRLPEGGRMAVVVDPESYVRLIFEVAGMPDCFDVVETREQGIALISSQG